MTIYINIISRKDIVEAIFPYADKMFQIIFNKYDIITNSFWKGIKQDDNDIEKMIWIFELGSTELFSILERRVNEIMPATVECWASLIGPITTKWKEIK